MVVLDKAVPGVSGGDETVQVDVLRALAQPVGSAAQAECEIALGGPVSPGDLTLAASLASPTYRTQHRSGLSRAKPAAHRLEQFVSATYPSTALSSTTISSDTVSHCALQSRSAPQSFSTLASFATVVPAPA